jgi:hypothetical protein
MLRFLVALMFGLSFSNHLPAQGNLSESPRRETEFRQLAAELADQRLNGTAESEALLEKALSILDQIILEHLKQSKEPELGALNQRLGSLVSRQPPLGERFELVHLGTPRVGRGTYALAANFSLSGPSAVRVYEPAESGYRLTGRIDRFHQQDFFDEYMEVIPIRASDLVFVTVTGRTDELKSGSFAAWRVHGRALNLVWSLEVVEHSSYEVRPDGFHIRYCSQADEENPRRCVKFSRERFVWDGSEWRRMEQEETGPPSP